MLCISLSCSRATDAIIDNVFPEPEGLEIGIKNNTNITFLRTEILTPNGNMVFQQIPAHSYSGFYTIPAVYDKVEMTVQTKNGYYSYKPIFYSEDTRVTKGRYYFEVSIEIPKNTLIITRKSF